MNELKREIHELKREMHGAKKMNVSWRAQLLIVVIGAPTVFLFGVYGRLALAMPLMIFTIMHALVIRFKWKLRRQAWFWIAIGVSAALHVLLILFVPWTTKWVPALVVSVGAAADFMLILWILLVVERFMEGPKTAGR